MANNISTALSTLTFSGSDLQRSDLSIHLAVTLGYAEVPEVRGSDTIIPSSAGRVFRNREMDRIPIELEGWIQGVGNSEDDRLESFAGLVHELKVLFDPTNDPDTLSGVNYAGDTMTIEARPLALRWGPEDIPGLRELTVLMEAVEDSFWEGGGS